MRILNSSYFTFKIFASGLVISGIAYAFTNNSSAMEMIVVFGFLAFVAFLMGSIIKLIKGN